MVVGLKLQFINILSWPDRIGISVLIAAAGFTSNSYSFRLGCHFFYGWSALFKKFIMFLLTISVCFMTLGFPGVSIVYRLPDAKFCLTIYGVDVIQFKSTSASCEACELECLHRL